MKKLIHYSDETHTGLVALAGIHTGGNLIEYISGILDKDVEDSGIIKILKKKSSNSKKGKSEERGAPIANMSKPREEES